MKDVQKFNIKTQQFETIEYGGYKANRAETPPDLIQQQPYIRRALEAFRIPILYYEGFEADDVIGTLSCKLSALGPPRLRRLLRQGHDAARQRDVVILNPTKDNLILDPAGVEAILGVPPERVIDVMALRGDSIDNIPGAPGIGDKGSVELIQQFGTSRLRSTAPMRSRRKPIASRYRTTATISCSRRNSSPFTPACPSTTRSTPCARSRSTTPPAATLQRARIHDAAQGARARGRQHVITYNLKPTQVQKSPALAEARAL
jgi:DNA polymerase-1